MCTFRCVCKMVPVGQIFGPQIGQYIGFSLFSGKVSTGFTQNLIYKFIRAIFVGV